MKTSSRLTSLRRIDKSALLISVLTFILATHFIAQTQAQAFDRRAKKRSTSTEATRLWSHDSLEEDSGDGGFVLDDHVLDIMEEEERVREEMKKAEKEQAKRPKSIFDSTTSCPYSFFPCQNGECLSPKWRCDGHYDCDDLSDELNCTNNTANADDKTLPIKPISGSPAKPATPSSTPSSSSSSSSSSSTDKASQSPEDKSEIKFNSMLEPMMLFSTGVSIRGYWMRSRIYFDIYSKNAKPRNENPTITQALSIFFDLLNIERQSSPSSSTSGSADSDKSRSTIVGVDMDHYEKEVFWVELGKDPGVYSTLIDSEQFESRYQRRQLAPPIRTVIDSGLLSPEDVALDSTSKNIYITDAGLPAIVVCSVKHSHCKILLSNELHKPRALIIDSSTGWLTYTDWGDHPGIYLVSMDGSKRETLINTDIIWPNGLAADYQANQLYWADARLKKIERLDLSTKKRKVLVKEEASNPFSLSMFENRIYWSDWSGSDILTCDKVSGNDTRTVMHTDNIYGIHIYHPSNYPKSSELDNPCWSMHCSHLCLLSPTATSYDKRKVGQVLAQCACPESMTLGIDKSTCYEEQLSFLLVNVKNYIAQVFPERIGLRTIEKLLHSKDHTIQDVAADWTNFKIFFYDFSKKHIYLMDLTKRNAKPEMFLTSTVSVRSLIYDSWSDNLYWLDSDQAALCMCSVSGKVETVLRRDMIAKPVSMVLDSKNRVFYLALAEPHTAAHIMRTDIMANEHSDLLIVDEDVGLPIAMHLDEQLQRLYYADAIHETIESVDLDVKSVRGWKAHSRIVHRKRLGAVLAFAVYNDYFLWTIKNGDYLYKAKIVNLNPLTQKPDNSRPIGLKLPKSATAKEANAEAKRLIIVDPTREADESLCEKLSCSHGCIVGADMNATCICPEGYVLQSPKNVDCQEAESIIHPAAAFIAAADSGKEVEAKKIEEENSMVWLIVLLLLLSISGLIVVLGLLIMYRQGKLPRQVSQLSVSFSSSSHDKDGAMLLLDNDT